MSCCIFKNCYNRPKPFSKITFFNLPKDSRRQVWLQKSGNEELAAHLPSDARRQVCEVHFAEPHIRRQFHRTTLSRFAVPLDYRIRKEPKDEKNDEENPVLEAIVVEENSEHSTEDGCSFILQTESEHKDDPDLIIEYYQEEEEEVLQEATPDSQSIDSDDAAMSLDLQQPENNHFAPQEENNSDLCVTSSSTAAATTGKNTDLDRPQTHKQSLRAPHPPAEQNPAATSANRFADKMTEDEYFAMSLVGPLQRLSMETRAIAKMKILTYLVQLECGKDAQLV
ncbi:uncharacterized protein LOC128740778 [Sabethes cyaneus]|uniref:uncharacterized protein LOC128740778 n=1 Tax=Sabethes cyaneus TaxID=53552 RepID=UPI00237DAC0F|nr:uncharacterized protein LOC128740778 [Sabethes cyaneus]